MKRIFDEYGGLIGKFIVNQIAMSLFGVMMSLTATAINNTWLLPFGLFGLLFYFAIVYSFVMEDGQKDAIKIEGGRMKKDSLKSLKYCGIAAFPAFIIALLFVLFSFIGKNSPFIQTLALVFGTVSRIFTYGMYNGIDRYFALKNQSFAFLSNNGITFIFYTVLTLAVCVISYNIGLVLKNNKKNK